jgi:hypothetical protein
MPFGKRPSPSVRALNVDFDRVYEFVKEGVQGAGVECVRADEGASGGMAHRPMIEQLIVAEYVVADLGFGNANVLYEIGLRHGSGNLPTILLCAKALIPALPFDVRPFRLLTYHLEPNGDLTDDEGRSLSEHVRKELEEARSGRRPSDNPIVQLTSIRPESRVDHEKTDAFMQRLEYAGAVGRRVREAARREVGAEDALAAIEVELLGPGTGVVDQLYTALLGIYLAYRDIKAYQRMVSLFERMPVALQRTAVAIEQLALALNRLAEAAARAGRSGDAALDRSRALERLNEIPRERWTSETFGIAGRIRKGHADALRATGKKAEAAAQLGEAIRLYQDGFAADPRDYYPGVNAVTLRLLRGTPDDDDELLVLLPSVQFSIQRAPAPRDESERYWQTATKLELHCVGQNWDVAKRVLDELLAIPVQPWMRESTAGNLRLLAGAVRERGADAAPLDELVDALDPGAAGST